MATRIQELAQSPSLPRFLGFLQAESLSCSEPLEVPDIPRWQREQGPAC